MRPEQRESWGEWWMMMSQKYLGVGTLGPVGGDLGLDRNTWDNLNRVLM